MSEETNKNLVNKPPVVVILGHVDHGKSSLLCAIKDFKIMEKESGGITQHIGAYEVVLPSVDPASPQSSQAEQKVPYSAQDDFTSQGRKITFIDTPGHEAFSVMRHRGAKIADIAILVVDVVEGVKKQTKEAIEAAKKAQLPIIVALTKIDRKMEAQPEKVKKELSENGILVESFGGKIPAIETSCKTNQGIEELLETILLIAEMENLKTNLFEPCQGIIIESLLDPQKGIFCTLILEKGILKENEILGTASGYGKVKQLSNFQGKKIKQGFPSQPVQVLGFIEAPKIGEKFSVFPDIEAAKKEIKKEKKNKAQVFWVAEGKKVLNIILKADVLGSLEAIEEILKNLSQEEVVLRILKSEVGVIGIADIQLANNAKAKIFGFRVDMDKNAKFYGEQKKIFPKTFDVIYELIEETRKAMEKLLSPEIKRRDLGKLKIVALFKKKQDNQIIGGKVLEGEITRDTFAEVVREEEIIGQGKIKNLQEEKREIVSAGKGREIGMLFVGKVEIKEGDILNIFKEEKEKKFL
ncbi:GTP-binding protein [Patescibacteria group bacterium]|nr:GTP-binding protein [Patescibacteria group bacterium]